MRKINFLYRIMAYGVAGFAGAVLSTIIVTGSVPKPVEVSPIPVVNFNNIGQQSMSRISSSSPFAEKDVAVNLPGNIKLPKVPDMPGDKGRAAVNKDVLTVSGLLPPDIVLLSKSGKTVMVHVGEKSDFGTVSSISAKGVVVNGKFIEMK